MEEDVPPELLQQQQQPEAAPEPTDDDMEAAVGVALENLVAPEAAPDGILDMHVSSCSSCADDDLPPLHFAISNTNGAS